MIVVTGTKRSGTSMWMQVLGAAGLRVLGEPFPKAWTFSIRQANPRGFFETGLRRGIGPQDAAALEEGTVVKVFAPGVLATDAALLGRVVVTVRDWRSQAASLERLYALEDGWWARRPLAPGETEERRQARLQRVRSLRGLVPASVEWFLENLALVRDARVRRYPHHLVTYGAMLADPAGRARAVLEWVGRGDPVAAARAVEPELRNFAHPLVPASGSALDPQTIREFDAFYAALQRICAEPAPAEAGRLPPDLLERLDAVEAALQARWAGQPRWQDAWDDPDT